ncbi:hypothetical protein BBK36DRAFT_1167615 [Trichoderma citrinoviride]|uniref:DUF3669 domain-containing protein n=1 Tax=Trichoderma citrinoviride TaxID=58853 RepID=A0A2T4BGB3_9HYPO|nr:hypothetical protein BBK36DRAFT_1167615 [Trichoderma citrinoviride]PTB68370.1 hypothetical protein BBK36DRAFT_1167615 [Trichoderma citrinoviride]
MIGAGACGAVFAQDEEKPLAAKLAKTNNGQLWNDYKMHNHIKAQFDNHGSTKIRIPEVYYFVPPDEAYTRYLSHHPELADAASKVCNLATSILVSERILPLPERARTLLIKKYCPPHIKEAALRDDANRDCLVRPYLGSMQGKTGGEGRFFSLRNFELHLNQMVDLQLDVEAMASSMGVAMAIMHWAAWTDARDVEFVLGSSAEETSARRSTKEVARLQNPVYTGPASHNKDDFFRQRTTEMWLLDFNQVQSITMDEGGVAKAVEAARVSDPYLPRPLGETPVEKQVWNAFEKTYLTAADAIVKGSPYRVHLPGLFIRGLVEAEEQRKTRAQRASDEV